MASPLLTGLISHYKLDSNSTDSLGVNSGTDTAISYANAGKIGNCATFNGSTSLVNLGTNTILKPTSVSVSLWVKTIDSTLPVLFSKKSSTLGGHDSYNITLNGANISSRIQTSASTYSDLNSSGGNVNNGNWHHLVITYNNGSHNIYIDSINRATGGSGTTINYESDVSAYIGCGLNTVPDTFFTGSIDEVGIWPRALSSTEVTQLYNGGAGLTYPFTLNSGFFNFF